MLGVNTWCTDSFPVHPKGLWGWGQGSMQDTRVFSQQHLHTMPSWSSLCTQRHCHDGTSLSSLVPVEGNNKSIACQVILDSCVLSTCGLNFGQKFKPQKHNLNKKFFLQLYSKVLNTVETDSTLLFCRLK